MLHVVLCKAPKGGFGVGRPQSQGGELDEFVVLLFDDLPVDRPDQDRLQVGVPARLTCAGPVEPLLLEAP